MANPFFAQEKGIDAEANLKLLKDPDMNVRIEALRKLEYSLHPDIPEACLRLLRDEGNSTRRIAARAIGSRWYQVPKSRIPEFVRLLERNKTQGGYNENWMARRAIGLLTRDYKDETFSQSASGRWVIYGRYSLPCLIDTTTETEELLGWGIRPEGEMWPWFYGDSAIKSRAVWHPQKDMVALDLSTNRYASTIWIWRHQKKFHRILMEDIEEVLLAAEKHELVGSQSLDLVGWQDDELFISFASYVPKGDVVGNYQAVLACDPATGKLRIVSLKVEEE